MSNYESSRLDRLEALAEKILEGLQETNHKVNSNAKAIEALANQWQKDREEWQKDRVEWRRDRARVFEWMSRLAAAQADFYEMQADCLTHLERIDDRLAQILEKLITRDELNH